MSFANPEKIDLVKHVSKVIGLDAVTVALILDDFDKYPRVYHSSMHIVDLWEKILADKHEAEQERLLLITALYHDYVYNPSSKTNEEDSAEIFWRDSEKLNLTNEGGSSLGNRNLVYRTILDTKTHNNFSSGFSEIF